MVSAAPPAPPIPSESGRIGGRIPGRIHGLDLARAIAMLGMVIVHYTRADDSGGVLNTVAEGAAGRAMPLFMMLGGIGACLAAARSTNPDRDLLTRAVLLMLMGLAVHELTARIAIVLQSYGLLFALAPLFRRLPRPALPASAAIATAVGAVTYQSLIPPPRFTTFDGMAEPVEFARSLFLDGYYPFFPVAGFFLFGMWLGGLDLRSDRIAGGLAIGGASIGFGVMVISNSLADELGLTLSRFDDDPAFRFGNLLNSEGHSQMPAWVLSAAGTSAAVIGLSILIAPRIGRWLSPVLALGRLALSFYVFQAVVIHLTPAPSETTLAQEFWLVAVIYVGFMIAAFVWRLFFRSGPLEYLLRIGSTRSVNGQDGRSSQSSLLREGPCSPASEVR